MCDWELVERALDDLEKVQRLLLSGVRFVTPRACKVGAPTVNYEHLLFSSGSMYQLIDKY